MNDVSSGGGGLRSTVRYVRLPLVVLTALLTMGSGWGNPGCSGGGDEELENDCLKGCEIQGTYQLTFEDSRPLGPECDAAGLSLPSGPLVLTRDSKHDGTITTTVGGVTLEGSYWGFPNRSLLLEATAEKPGPEGRTISFTLRFRGDFAQGPERASEPATYSGTFTLEQWTEGPRCVVERAFTATR